MLKYMVFLSIFELSFALNIVDYTKISNKNGKIYVKNNVYTGIVKYKKDIEFYVDGIPDGKWISFYPNGRLKAIENWKNGELNGKYILYNKEGIKTFETYYVSGKDHGLFKLFHNNGKPHVIGEFSYGKNIGIWFYYNQNGKLVGKRDMDNLDFHFDQKIK